MTIIYRDHKENGGWTVKEVALKLDISESTVKDWCRENNIRRQIIVGSSTGQKGYILYEEEIKELAISVGKVFKEEKRDLLRKPQAIDPSTPEGAMAVGLAIYEHGKQMKALETTVKGVEEEVKKVRRDLFDYIDIVQIEKDKKREINEKERQTISDYRKKIATYLMSKEGGEYNNPEFKQQQRDIFFEISDKQESVLGYKNCKAGVTKETFDIELLPFYRKWLDDITDNEEFEF